MRQRFLILRGLTFLTLTASLLLSFQNCSAPHLSKFPSNQQTVALYEDEPISTPIIPISSQSPNSFIESGPKVSSIIPEMENLVEADKVDALASNCTAPELAGWKCLNTVIRNSDNQPYQVLLKWNRPHLSSRGSIALAVGGSGVGESRQDPPSKLVMDRLSEQDQLRTIQIEYLDPPPPGSLWGGYWVHVGGYKSAGSVFAETIKFIVNKQIVRGKFLNYMGGSNASTIAAYAMSHYGIDKYFDRVVFQMGPFLPSLQTACDPNSASRFTVDADDIQKQQLIISLINAWRYGDANHNVCTDQSNDRISILGDRINFKTTHVHVIIGQLEDPFGFGKWILNSNLEWYNVISARTKTRILRPNMAHNNSYQDMRRFLKLAPDELAEEDRNFIDKTGEFCAYGKITEYNCRAEAQILPPTADSHIKWVPVGNGCFHLATNKTCTTQ